MRARSKLITGAIAIAGSFLLGFVPQYREVGRLQSEMAETQSELSKTQLHIRIDELRNLAGRMLLEALQQNYGVARELSTQYFDKLTQLAAETESPALKGPLSTLVGQRDAITAGLTQGSPSVIPDLQSLLRRTYDLPDAENPRK